MPKVRDLVTQEVMDVDDATAQAGRAAGRFSLIEDEERNAAAAAEGNYSAVTGRDDVAGPKAGPSGGPQEDDPAPKKGRK